MGNRGRFKGWRSPKTIAKMSEEERAAYEVFLAQREEKLKEDPDYVAPEPKEDSTSKEALVQKAVELSKGQEERFKDVAWVQDSDDETVTETTISHCYSQGYCYIETNETYWIRQIVKWLEQTPDKVYVEGRPYTNEDMIRVRVPYSVMKKCKPSKDREVSETEQERRRELGRKMGLARRKNVETESVKSEG